MSPKKYIGEVIKEGKRVRYPKREQFWPAMAVVICISVFVALFLLIEDMAALNILNILKDAFEGV